MREIYPLTILQEKLAICGGSARKPASEIGFVISIMVGSIKDTVDLIIAKGGKIVEPVNIEAPEKIARFSDPFGNIFGLYQQ